MGTGLQMFALTHGLTDREQDLLRLLARGLDTRELADAMTISETTVQDHVKSVFAKTGTSALATPYCSAALPARPSI